MRVQPEETAGRDKRTHPSIGFDIVRFLHGIAKPRPQYELASGRDLLLDGTQVQWVTGVLEQVRVGDLGKRGDQVRALSGRRRLDSLKQFSRDGLASLALQSLKRCVLNVLFDVARQDMKAICQHRVFLPGEDLAGCPAPSGNDGLTEAQQRFPQQCGIGHPSQQPRYHMAIFSALTEIKFIQHGICRPNCIHCK